MINNLKSIICSYRDREHFILASYIDFTVKANRLITSEKCKPMNLRYIPDISNTVTINLLKGLCHFWSVSYVEDMLSLNQRKRENNSTNEGIYT